MRRALGSFVVLGLALFPVSHAYGYAAEKLNAQGYALAAQKKYEDAVPVFREAEVRFPDEAVLHYNVGNGLYELGDFQGAADAYQAAREDVGSSGAARALRSDVVYNLGNSMYRLGRYDEAMRYYEEALQLRPEDEDAKHNLEFLKKTKDKFKHGGPDASQKPDLENSKSLPEQNPQNQKNQKKDSSQNNNQGAGGTNSDSSQTPPPSSNRQADSSKKNKPGGEGNTSGPESKPSGQNDHTKSGSEDPNAGKSGADQKSGEQKGPDAKNQPDGQSENNSADARGQGQEKPAPPNGSDATGRDKKPPSDHQGGEPQKSSGAGEKQTGQPDESSPRGSGQENQGSTPESSEKGESGKEEKPNREAPQPDSQGRKQAGEDQSAREKVDEKPNPRTAPQATPSDEKKNQPGQTSKTPSAGSPSVRGPGFMNIFTGLSPTSADRGEDEDAESVGVAPASPDWQGKMPYEEAVRILNTLHSSERQIQALRRPAPSPEAVPKNLKDW